MKNFKTKSKMSYIISGIVSGIILIFFILLGIVVPQLRQILIDANSLVYIWQKIILGINLPIGLTIGIICAFGTILKDKYCSRKLSLMSNGLIVVFILFIAVLVLFAASGPGLGMAE